MIDHSASDNASPPAPTPDDILGFDPYEYGFLRDPYSRYRKLPRPLYRRRPARIAAASRVLRSAVRRGRRFGHGHQQEPGRDAPARSFLMMDPPDHTRLRGLVSKAFTPGMVRR